MPSSVAKRQTGVCSGAAQAKVDGIGPRAAPLDRSQTFKRLKRPRPSFVF